MRREESIRHTPSAIAAYATASPRDAPRDEEPDLAAENFSRRRSALATATETSGSAARRLRAAAFFEDMSIPGAAPTRDARAGVSAGTCFRRCGFLLSRKTGEEHFLRKTFQDAPQPPRSSSRSRGVRLSNVCSLANAYIHINKATHA
jgi:hypothetical protein